MVERIATESGDVDVLEAIVVVVSDGDSHVVMVLRHPGQACLFGNIGESAVGILVIEPIPEFLVGLVRHVSVRHGIVDLRAVGEENIEAAVVVVIEQSYAAAHGFDQIFVRCG